MWEAHFWMDSPLDKLVAMLDPGWVIKYPLPATSWGWIKQSCSWPHIKRSISSPNPFSGTEFLGPCATLCKRKRNWRWNGIKNARMRTWKFGLVDWADRFWWTSIMLNHSSRYSTGFDILIRLLLISKWNLSSRMFPIPYIAKRVLPFWRRTGWICRPSSRASSSFWALPGNSCRPK